MSRSNPSAASTKAIFTRVAFAIMLGSAVEAVASAQSVVQLPTFRTFRYSGSVLVPDRGTAALGSVARSSSASRSPGRGIGRSQSVGGASVTATIIDHRAIDEQLRGLPEGGGSSSVRPSQVAEAKALVRYARRANREGRTDIAKTAYRMAIARLSGRLRRYAEAEMKRAFIDK